MAWVAGAGHVITVDYGWEQVAERTVTWLESRVPAGGTPTGAAVAPVPSPAPSV